VVVALRSRPRLSLEMRGTVRDVTERRGGGKKEGRKRGKKRASGPCSRQPVTTLGELTASLAPEVTRHEGRRLVNQPPNTLPALAEARKQKKGKKRGYENLEAATLFRVHHQLAFRLLFMKVTPNGSRYFNELCRMIDTYEGKEKRRERGEKKGEGGRGGGPSLDHGVYPVSIAAGP